MIDGRNLLNKQTKKHNSTKILKLIKIWLFDNLVGTSYRLVKIKYQMANKLRNIFLKNNYLIWLVQQQNGLITLLDVPNLFQILYIFLYKQTESFVFIF